MNKAVKDALAKGKALRAELDEKAVEEAKQRKEQQEAKEAEEKAKLQAEAERYLSYIPAALTDAVAKRKDSFTVLTCESDKNERFKSLCVLMEPKIKKMGLQSKHTSSRSWIDLTFDPDTGYEATFYHLEVIVPNEE